MIRRPEAHSRIWRGPLSTHSVLQASASITQRTLSRDGAQSDGHAPALTGRPPVHAGREYQGLLKLCLSVMLLLIRGRGAKL